MDPTWFHAFVERCQKRSSIPSAQSWVAAHAHLSAPPIGVKRTPPVTRSTASRSVEYSARNDVRTSAAASGAGVDLDFSHGSSTRATSSIFADSTLHDQAAATLASLAQSSSGFTASMEGVALDKFLAYLQDFEAPHWEMPYYQLQTVRHESSNHSQFVGDLVGIVTQGLQAVEADTEATERAEETVRSLAARLSSNNSTEEKLTLYSTFLMDRADSTARVTYGIFFLTLEAKHEQNGKAQILSTDVDTYSIIFKLNSNVLIQYAELYDRLVKSSVEDWFNSHSF